MEHLILNLILLQKSINSVSALWFGQIEISLLLTNVKNLFQYKGQLYSSTNGVWVQKRSCFFSFNWICYSNSEDKKETVFAFFVTFLINLFSFSSQSLVLWGTFEGVLDPVRLVTWVLSDSHAIGGPVVLVTEVDWAIDLGAVAVVNVPAETVHAIKLKLCLNRVI